MSKRLTLVLLCCLAAAPAALAANWPDRPTLRAVRVDGARPSTAISPIRRGRRAPEFTDFTQHDPNDGAAGDDADQRPHRCTTTRPSTSARRWTIRSRRRRCWRAATRSCTSDFLSINIDPQHDRLSGAAFTVTPSNVQIDSILYNDIGEDGELGRRVGVGDEDRRRRLDRGGARAVLAAALSGQADATCGASTSRAARCATTSGCASSTRRRARPASSRTSPTSSGWKASTAGAPLELVPYAVARSDVRTRADRDESAARDVRSSRRRRSGSEVRAHVEPHADRHDQSRLRPGGSRSGGRQPQRVRDVLSGEAAVLHRGAEHLPLRRLAGAEPLQLHLSAEPVLLAAHRPRAAGLAVDAEFVAAPAETTILGAAKVTGKLAGGWSVGVLDALTDTERARFVDGAGRERDAQHVEPMTNYFVSRATKEIGDGSRVGMLVTSVNRRLADELSVAARDRASPAGVDGYT